MTCDSDDMDKVEVSTELTEEQIPALQVYRDCRISCEEPTKGRRSQSRRFLQAEQILLPQEELCSLQEGKQNPHEAQLM